MGAWRKRNKLIATYVDMDILEADNPLPSLLLQCKMLQCAKAQVKCKSETKSYLPTHKFQNKVQTPSTHSSLHQLKN